VHEYGVDESRAPQGEALTSQTASSSHEFSVLAKPNPFNPSTSIQFTLPSEGVVRLRIYNLQGQLVRELLHEQRPAGAHTVTWDGKNDRGSISASGIYFLRLESSKLSKVSRLTLLR
jgi:flagellar hook assembly protein FlgD